VTQAKEAAFYNEFHRDLQTGWPPWYRYALPDLARILTPQTRLVELGCGQSMLLRHLARERLLPEENIYGLDQSSTAVDHLRQAMPKAHLGTGDIYRLEYPPNHFQVCLLMETIEHLEDPMPALRQIFSVVAPGGVLYVSFPNFLSLPWLPVRILSEKLNKPNWVVLQPIDKIYTVFGVIRLLERAGFKFDHGIGSGYGPPVLYQWEADWMTRALNALRLWRFSFHPILVFRKPEAPASATALSK
jgi:SAM-dependent methyltransferase